MDKAGYFNFSVSPSHQMATFDVSKIKIVEVNQNLPRALGGTEVGIHISEVDYIIEGSQSPPRGPAGICRRNRCDKAVARLIVEENP